MAEERAIGTGVRMASRGEGAGASMAAPGGRREGLAGRARALAPDGFEALFAAGLGLYLAWVDNMFYGARIVEREWSPFQAVPSGDVLYYVSILTLTALLALLAWRGARADRLLYGARTAAVSTVGMAASTLLILAALAGGPLEAVCIPLAGVLTALSSGVRLMQWGRLASMLSYRGIVVTGALSYALSSCVVVLAQTVGAAMRFEPRPVIVVMTGLNCLMAVLSGAMFAKVARRVVPPGAADPAAPAAADPAGADGRGGEDAGTVARMAAALVLIGLVPVLARGMGLGLVRRVGADSGLWYVEVHLGSLAVLVLAAVCIEACFLAEGARRQLGRCYRAIVLLALAGTLAVPLPFVFHDASLVMPSILATSAFNCLHVVMWIGCAALCRAHADLSTRYFACVRLGWTLGPLAGELLAGALWGSGALAGSGPQASYLVGAASAVGVFAMHAYVFPERSLARALDVMPRRVRRPFQERCEQIARACGLSDRELEIMMYFAKGRDAAYIQQELVLTHSTVSSHRQHIYAKLGVHSQQELLDLLSGDAPVQAAAAAKRDGTS